MKVTQSISKIFLGAVIISFVLLFSNSAMALETDTDSSRNDSVSATVKKNIYDKLPKDDTCISCHIKEDEMPEGFSQNDIHMQNGLSCVGCHGGDNTADDEDVAMNEDIGFTGAPDAADIPKMCGKCHSDINFMRKFNPRMETDQVEQYFQSVHGKKLKHGDENVATCASCHTAHGIMKPNDPRSSVYALNVPKTCNKCHGDADYMAGYKIPTDQYEKYAHSVHGIALLERQDTGAPACNDCHGNHGATPPGVNSVINVCGSCHVQNETFFNESKMAVKWKQKDKHACIECHGHHAIAKPTDNFVGTSKKAVCVDCHDKGDKGFLVADSIHVLLNQASVLYDSAQAVKENVVIVGMDDVELGFILQDAHQAIVHARTTVHTFTPVMVKEKTDEAVKNAQAAIALGKKELDDYSYRRFGLGISTLIITLLVIVLFFKIKSIEKEQANQ